MKQKLPTYRGTVRLFGCIEEGGGVAPCIRAGAMGVAARTVISGEWRAGRRAGKGTDWQQHWQSRARGIAGRSPARRCSTLPK